MPAPDAASLFDPLQLLDARVRAAIRAAAADLGKDAGDAEPLISPSKQLQLADFQSNAAMGLAKRWGIPPRDAAKAIVARLDLGDLAEPLTDASIAGPGFINIRLRPAALANLLLQMNGPALGLPPAAEPQTVVVDLCGVNLAKQMHVGHLRSIIIGDAIARTLERLGHRVIRQNHVGDWGLPIAMVAARLQRESAAARIDLSTLTLDALERAYRAAQRACDADEKGLAAVHRYNLGPKALAELDAQVSGAQQELAHAKQTLIKLQSGDPATIAVWKRIADVTLAECLAACARLKASVLPEHSAGESSYAAELAGLVDDLASRRVAEPSDGALIVRLNRDPWNIEEPCLIRKSDGGYLYATTDLAAIRRRVRTLGAARVIYCVDARQSLHFKQVFAVATLAGYAGSPPARLDHAAFGMVLGEDGRPFKTRSGDNVKLSDLIDESIAAAAAVVRQKNPDHSDADVRATAEAVGVAAIKYADLSSDRARDYVFSFSKMLAFEGNTGPYLLYALVRIRSIFRKAAERGIAPDAHTHAPFTIQHPHEKTLALALLKYPSVIRSVADALEPHRLCGYLYELATAFSSFFDACPVLQAETDDARHARLKLCDLTARVLTDGLGVLGIPALDRM